MPFTSYLLPLCQNEPSCKIIHMKMSSACIMIFMQIKPPLRSAHDATSPYNKSQGVVASCELATCPCD